MKCYFDYGVTVRDDRILSRVAAASGYRRKISNVAPAGWVAILGALGSDTIAADGRLLESSSTTDTRFNLRA
jgi:hypothetical protein